MEQEEKMVERKKIRDVYNTTGKRTIEIVVKNPQES